MGRRYVEIGEGKGMGVVVVVQQRCGDVSAVDFKPFASCRIRPMIVALAG
jgi:hypothetical protein